MLQKLFVLIGVALLAPWLAAAQNLPTASRRADLQVGASFSLADPDYGAGAWHGYGAYVDFKLLPGLNLRVADFDYQSWPSFPAHGLTPAVISFGIAYHFHCQMELKR